MSVQIEKYEFNLDHIIKNVDEIAQNLIKKLVRIIPVDSKTINVYDAGQSNAFTEADNQIVTCDDPSLKTRTLVQQMNRSQQLELFVENNMMQDFI